MFLLSYVGQNEGSASLYLVKKQALNFSLMSTFQDASTANAIIVPLICVFEVRSGLSGSSYEIIGFLDYLHDWMGVKWDLK